MTRRTCWISSILRASSRNTFTGVEEAEFERDRGTRGAVIYELLIIGEAAKKVSTGFRTAHPEIPWKKMAGMRDVLIHNYRDVDVPNVWTTATESIPALISALEPLVAEIEGGLEEQENTRSDDA